MQAAKQAVVIEYPVKRRGAKKMPSNLCFERQVRQVATGEFDARTENPAGDSTGGGEHVLGEVEAHYLSARQGFQKDHE